MVDIDQVDAQTVKDIYQLSDIVKCLTYFNYTNKLLFSDLAERLQ